MKSSLLHADFVRTSTRNVSGEYDSSIAVAGTAKLYIDDELVVDNEIWRTHGDSSLGTGTIGEFGTKSMTAECRYDIRVAFGSDPTITYERHCHGGFGPGNIRMGASKRVDLAAKLENARQIAQSADQVVPCIGLNGDWESEGFDRPHMQLPAGSDELVQIVCEANPNTAVVVQSGTPVSMPWFKQVKSIVQAWYGGNECGNGIADVLYGAVNPGGRLPMSFPVRNQDNPAFLNFPSDRNRILYG